MSLRDENEVYLYKTSDADRGTYWISIQSDEQKYVSNAAVGSLATYNCIPCTSANPDRAMKLMELLRTEQGAEILNMLCYGIEGKHYEKISATQIKPIEYPVQRTTSSAYAIPNWMGVTHFNMYAVSPYTEETRTRAIDYYENIYPKFHKTKIYGLAFDTLDVANYYSQVNAVLSEYQLQLYSGAFEDYEAKYAEACTKLKAAGVDKIIKEMQKQVDEFIAK